MGRRFICLHFLFGTVLPVLLVIMIILPNVHGGTSNPNSTLSNGYSSIPSAHKAVNLNSSTPGVESGNIWSHATDIAFDPMNGLMYVTNMLTNYVSVYNTSSGSIVASILVNQSLGDMAFDPANGYIYVLVGSYYVFANTIDVIDTKTQAVIGNITVKVPPIPEMSTISLGIISMEFAYDPMNQCLYGVTGSTSIFVISSNDNVSEIDVGGISTGIVYNPSNGYVYVTDGSNLSLLNSTNKIVDRIPLGYKTYGNSYYENYLPKLDYRFNPLFYSPSNGYLYGAQEDTNRSTTNITVMNPANGQILYKFPLQEYSNVIGMAYDPLNGYIYVTVTDTNNEVLRINPVTENVSAVGGLAAYSQPEGIAFDPLNGNIYTANAIADNITMFSAPMQKYGITFYEQGLPANSVWYINLTGGLLNNLSLSGSMILKVPDGVYHYTVATTDKSYGASGGSFAVYNSTYSLYVTFRPELYPVTFLFSNFPAGSVWYVNVTGMPSSGPIRGSTYTTDLMNGSHDYSISVYHDSGTHHSSGNIVVNGSASAVIVKFAPSLTDTIEMLLEIGSIVAVVSVAVYTGVRRKKG